MGEIIVFLYFLDDDTDWSEGMNSAGIGVINSALMVNADEKEKKMIKLKGTTSEEMGVKLEDIGVTTRLDMPFTSKVLEEAKKLKALTIAISNNPYGKILKFGKLKIRVRIYFFLPD